MTKKKIVFASDWQMNHTTSFNCDCIEFLKPIEILWQADKSKVYNVNMFYFYLSLNDFTFPNEIIEDLIKLKSTCDKTFLYATIEEENKILEIERMELSKQNDSFFCLCFFKIFK